MSNSQKLFSLALGLILLSPFLTHADTIATCATSNSSNPGDITSLQYVGQEFTTPNDGNSYTVSELDVTLKASVTPGNSYALIYAASADLPVGQPLGNSGPITGGSFSSSFTSMIYTFSTSTPTLNPNTNYFFIITNTSSLLAITPSGTAGVPCGGKVTYSDSSQSNWSNESYNITPFTLIGSISGGGSGGGAATSTSATSTGDDYSQSEENLYHALLLFAIGFFGMIWLIRKH